MFDSLISRDGARLELLAYIFLALLSFAFFVPGIASLPPTDRDESSFAQATKQMIETGDYVDIRLQDKPRYQKPIGIYWLQAASVRLLNPDHLNEIWAYRIPSLLGAVIAVLMTAATGSLLFGPLAGLLAALMLAGCVSLNVEAHLAKTDAALLACVTVAQYGLARAYKEQAQGWGIRIAFWAALGCGILIKGPIILLVLASTLLWLYVTEKNLKWFYALKPSIGILFLLLLIAPWFIAITAASHGQFMEKSAGHDMLGKLWQGQNRGMLPPGLHLLILPVMFFPFSLFTLLGAAEVWRSRHESAIRFCLGWIIPTWLVFELSLTKLPHYTLPVFPAIALLSAYGLAKASPQWRTSPRPWAIALITTIWLLIGSGFAIGFALMPSYLDQTFNGIQAAAGLLLLLTQAAALILVLGQRLPAAIACLSLGALIFFSTVFGGTLPRLSHVWLSRDLVNEIGMTSPCPAWRLVSVGYSEPSLVFLAGTGTLLTENTAEAAQQLRHDRCGIAVIDDRHRDAFVTQFGTTNPPKLRGEITGLNTGHGSRHTLFLYGNATDE